jgi:hypothetical protein
MGVVNNFGDYGFCMCYVLGLKIVNRTKICGQSKLVGGVLIFQVRNRKRNFAVEINQGLILIEIQNRCYLHHTTLPANGDAGFASGMRQF